MRFPISFTRANRALMGVLLLHPERADVDVGAEGVRVRFGWGFGATIPRPSVRMPRRGKDVRLTAGVHGWRGHWLVNGAGAGIVTFDVEPRARARILGLPLIRLRQLSVSVEDPDALLAALQP